MIKKLNSLVEAIDYITLIPPMLALRRCLNTRSPKTKQLINLKAPLPAIHFSALLPPVKNISHNTKLKERIIHDYFRKG